MSLQVLNQRTFAGRKHLKLLNIQGSLEISTGKFIIIENEILKTTFNSFCCNAICS